ncbi:hypothetical protein CC79DRAFT_1363041 [Sarocladium strictum]
MVLHAFQPCNSKPTFHESYGDPKFTPEFTETMFGPAIVSPDTPYVAFAGRHHLYYIDTRFSPEDAAHIKAQVEHTWRMKGDEYIKIDEIEATAEVGNAAGETVFVFDTPYARVLFADFINRRNPDIKLPEHGPGGEWLVPYQPASDGTLEKRVKSSSHGSETASDCARPTDFVCGFCKQGRVDDVFASSQSNSVGTYQPLCARKVDTPRFEGETDADYYQRMDKLHWGDKKVKIPGTEKREEQAR